jgi:hypothetical protein
MSRLASVLLIAAASTVAQPAEVEELQREAASLAARISRAIGTPDARTAAWGAHLAGRYRLVECAPALMKLLSSPPGEPEAERPLVIRAALDALIRIEANPGREELEAAKVLRRFHPMPFILLARNAKANQGYLLDLVARKRTGIETWIAAANLLAELEAPGFAYRLLHDLELELSITVVDPGAPRRAGAHFAFGHGDGFLRVVDGFPPTALYRLALRPRTGDVLLAPGSRPVFFRRWERGGDRVGFGGSSPTLDRDMLRLEYLSTLLAPGSLPDGLAARTQVRIVWQNEDRFVDDAEIASIAIETAWREAVAALEEKGRLTSKEVRELVLPEIEIEVEDRRQDQEIPLPPLRR